MNIQYSHNLSTFEDIYKHLKLVSPFFLPPLEGRVDIEEYAKKLFKYAEREEAYYEKELIGFVAYYYTKGEKEAFISNVSVLQRFKNKGIASTLLNHVRLFLFSMNMHRVSMEVANNNNIIDFYRKKNFDLDKEIDSTKFMMVSYLKSQKPLVSILCLTFNHEDYIRNCLDGFVMQKTNFPIEILIHDDASTDKTPDIIREYELKYPDIIKPIYQTENQYSKGVKVSATFNFPRAKGKYIAICEGDDYWIDPLKLQKQVDFLEMYPEYSLTCGGYLYGYSQKKVVLAKESISFNLDTYTKWYTKTLTVMFRFEFLKDYFDIRHQYKYERDIHIFYHLLKKGKGFYFTDVFGVYNVHQGGICSMVPILENSKNSYNCYKELYAINKDEYCRYMYFRSILNILYNKENLYPCIRLTKEGIGIVKRKKEFILLFLYNLPLRYIKQIITKCLKIRIQL